MERFREINWTALLENSKLNGAIQKHLVNVYTTLSLCILFSAFGFLFYLKTLFFVGGLLGFIASLGLIFWLSSVPPEEVTKRLSILFSFSFLEGLSIGPLLELAIEVDPSIIVSAFLGTCCIFLCFSGSALLSDRRSFLYLGGFLGSALSLLSLFSLMNFFIGSTFLFNIQLYGGLLLFCGFIVFDTQLVIHRAANGKTDFVWDTLGLFLDFLNVFVRIVIILLKQKNTRREK